MRYFLVALSFVIVVLMMTSSRPAHDRVTRKAMKKYTECYNSGHIMFGHQNDILHGRTWGVYDGKQGFERSDVFDVCGKYPAVLGADIAGVEFGKAVSNNYIPFTTLCDALKHHYLKGGVITLSWHMANPITDETAWTKCETEVLHEIIANPEVNSKFILWLDRAAEFMKTIKDSNGKPIPILYRPLHEYNSTHFWWGYQNTDEDFIAVWQLMYNTLVIKHKLKNLIWVYSPYYAYKIKDLERRYPGDKYVDIVGFERYQVVLGKETKNEAIKRFIGEVRDGMGVAEKFASPRKKIVAFCETGFSANLNFPDWWTNVLDTSLEGIKCLYALTWANFRDTDIESYGPHKALRSVEDFKIFSNSNKWLFRNR